MKRTFFLIPLLILSACDGGLLPAGTTSPSQNTEKTNASDTTLPLSPNEIDVDNRVAGSWRHYTLKSFNSLVPIIQKGVQLKGTQYLIRGATLQGSTQYSLHAYDGQKTRVVIERLPIEAGNLGMLTDGKHAYLYSATFAANSPKSIARLTQYNFDLYRLDGDALTPVYQTEYFQSRDKAVDDGRFLNGSLGFYQGRLTLAYRSKDGLALEQLEGETWQRIAVLPNEAQQLHMLVTSDDRLFLHGKSLSESTPSYLFQMGNFTPVSTEGIGTEFTPLPQNAFAEHQGKLYYAASTLTSLGQRVGQVHTVTLFEYDGNRWSPVYQPTEHVGDSRRFRETWERLESDGGKLFVMTRRQAYTSTKLNQHVKGIKVFDSFENPKEYIGREWEGTPNFLEATDYEKADIFFFHKSPHVVYKRLHSFVEGATAEEDVIPE